MERMLINATRDEKRVALVQENVLFDFITERPGFEQKIGNIYLARITSIEPSLDAVFVEFGSERHGFLPLKEISRQYFSQKSEQYDRPGIRDLLRVGQELLIQVEKEERGNKGAALTTYISLAGSYLVLMPNSPRAGGISRRIEGDERDQLREILSQVTIPDGMGLIVRTAAIGRTNDELKWDLDVLLSHWRNIEAASKSRSAPALIHAEGNVVVRAIRDYVRQDTAEIIIDDETEYQNAKHYLEQIRPDIADRVKLYTDTTPLFSRYGIEHQIETAYKRAIDLPSGASIVIDYTEALVSIDVNSARATKGGSIETTAFNTNIEAAEEIARQLRLRDIGGLIVIDFIDMLETKHQYEVEKHLTNALKYDRARIQIQRISRFGLLEMSRQRLRPSLRDSHQHVCPTCSGHGTIRSVETVALTLVRIIEEEALKPQTSEVVIQASTEAATYLLNEKRHLLAAIEKNHGVKVSVVPNPNLQSSNHTKKRIRLADTDEGGRSSSDRLQEPTVEINLPSSTERAPAHKPAVQQMIPTRPDKAAASGGLFKRIWDTMFGHEEETVESAADETFQQKPAYTPRTPSRGQRPTRRPRADEGAEGRESRDSREPREPRERSTESRERSSTGRRHADSRSGERGGERSGQRSGDSRQRTGGSRQRTGGRSTAGAKPISGAKSTHYSDNPIEEHYNEYSQNVDHTSSTSRPKTPHTPEHPVKSTHIDKMADEAPITIKASTGSSHAPTFRSAPSSTSPAPSSTGTAHPTTSSSERPTSSTTPSTTASSQRLASTTSYAPRSTTSPSVRPTQQRSTTSYAPSSSTGVGGAGTASSGTTPSSTQTAGTSSAGVAASSTTSGTQSSSSTTIGTQPSGITSGSSAVSTSGGTQGTGTTSGGTQGTGSASGGTQGSGSTSGSTQGSGSASGGTQGSGSTSGGTQGSGSASGGTQGSGSTSGGAQGTGSTSSGTQTSGYTPRGTQGSGSTSSGTQSSGSSTGSTQTGHTPTGTQGSGSTSSDTPTSGSSSSDTHGSSSISSGTQTSGTHPSSKAPITTTSSTSTTDDNQKPLIVRASTTEEKPSTTTSSTSTDKKDKENSDA